MVAAINILADVADGDGFNHMWGGGALGWVWAAIMMTMMVAVAAAVISWLLRGGPNTPARPSFDPTHEAKSILAKRLANGEVTPEEYRERLSHLD